MLFRSRGPGRAGGFPLLVDLYILRGFIAHFLLTLLGFLVLFDAFTFFELLEDIARHNASSLLVANLNTLDGKTTGVVDAGSVQAMEGSASGFFTAYGANGTSLTGLGDEALKLTDQTLSALELNGLRGATTGGIDAGSLMKLTGSVGALTTAYTASGIAGLHNEAVQIDDTEIGRAHV